MTQQEAAAKEMSMWLSHPGELGKVPDRMECTKAFQYLGRTYYIFKFRKQGLFSKWSLGICGGYEGDELEHSGHVFSRFEEYIPQTEEQDAIRAIETVRQFWIEQVNKMPPSEQ